MNQVYKAIERIIFQLIRNVFRIFHKELSDEIFLNIMQFVRFGLVGLSNTIVSYVVYIFSLLTLNSVHNSRYNYFIAQTLAFFLSVLWSYYWNSKKVFTTESSRNRSRADRIYTLLKTYLTYAFTGLVLSNVLLFLWIDILSISEYIAPLINLVVTVPVNFLLNKFWAFK